MPTQVRLRNLKGDIAFVLTSVEEPANLPEEIHVLFTCGPEAPMRNGMAPDGTVIAQAPCQLRIFDKGRIERTGLRDPEYQEIEQKEVGARMAANSSTLEDRLSDPQEGQSVISRT